MTLGDLQTIHRWLTLYWRAMARTVLPPTHQLNGETSLQEWSQGQELLHYATVKCSRLNSDLERFRCRVSVQVTGASGDQEALPQGGRAKRGRRFWRYPKVLMQLINDESEQLSSLVIRNLSQK